MAYLDSFLRLFAVYWQDKDKAIADLLDALDFVPLVIVCYSVFYLLNPANGEHVFERFVIGVYKLIFNLFFRSANITGSEKIPPKGKMVFVCAPHANQYVDGITIVNLVPRKVYFMAAASSFKKPVISFFLSGMNSIIPVARAQDYAKPGEGLVTVENKKLKGTETHFVTQLAQCGSIVINKQQLKIVSVESDTEATIADDFSQPTAASFKVVPRIDHHQLYVEVHRALDEEKAIAIFPEGGSHDRTTLLEFYHGCASIPLSYMSQHPGEQVTIIPVGMNYFNGHRFRSRVSLVIGDPLVISSSIIDMYHQGESQRREAVSELLDQIKLSVRSCIVEMHGGETTYNSLWIARQLYTPMNVDLSLEDKTQLTINFSRGYAALKDHKVVNDLRKKIDVYLNILNVFGIRDEQVRQNAFEQSFSERVSSILKCLAEISFFVLFAVPGLFLMCIPGLIASTVSQIKAKEALKNSTVKLVGTDVMATWKVVVSIVVFPIVIILNAITWNFLRVHYYHHPSLTYNQLFTFIFLQPFIMYCGVRCAEVGIKRLRKLWTILLSIFLKRGGEYVLSLREDLHLEITKLVNQFGPKVFGSEEEFARERVIIKESSAVIPRSKSKSISELNEDLNEIYSRVSQSERGEEKSDSD